MKKNIAEEQLIKIDFEEFDEVILGNGQITAKKDCDEDFEDNFDSESDFELDDDSMLDVGDFDEEVGVTVSDDESNTEELDESVEDEFQEIDESACMDECKEELEECAGAMTQEELDAEIAGKGKGVTECAGSMFPDEFANELDRTGKHNNNQQAPEIQVNGDIKSTNKSLASLYESRMNRKRNKLVEALLVDNTVETIETVLKNTLKAHGISKAEQTVTIGLILDRMLNATDDDVAAPDFLECIIHELVDNKDIKDVVKCAIEDALEGKECLPAPGLVDVDDAVKVVSSDNNGKPVSYGEFVEKKVESEEE